MRSKSASDQEAVASASFFLRHNALKVGSKFVAQFVEVAWLAAVGLGLMRIRLLLIEKRLCDGQCLGVGGKNARRPVVIDVGLRNLLADQRIEPQAGDVRQGRGGFTKAALGKRLVRSMAVAESARRWTRTPRRGNAPPRAAASPISGAGSRTSSCRCRDTPRWR